MTKSVQPSRPLATVVIPTYRSARSIRRLISLLEPDPAVGEIIIVDDSSPDVAAVREAVALGSPLARLIELPENSGPAVARHIGAKRAQFGYIVFLDDDVTPGHGLISAHVKALAIGSVDVSVGYMPVALDFLTMEERGVAALYSRQYESQCVLYDENATEILRNLWAGNFAVRSAIYRTLDLSDVAEFPRYYEDKRLGSKLADAGASAAFSRSLRAEHNYRRGLDGLRIDIMKQVDAHLGQKDGGVEAGSGSAVTRLCKLVLGWLSTVGLLYMSRTLLGKLGRLICKTGRPLPGACVRLYAMMCYQEHLALRSRGGQRRQSMAARG